MDNQKLSAIFNAAKTKVVKNGPAILTAMGIVGWGTATVLAVKETPKALKLLEDAEYEKGERLTVTEKVKATWKQYLPAALLATASTGCLIGACKVSAGRTAALATAYQLSATALKDYKEQVAETVGEKKEQAIREKVHKKKIEENPVSNTQVHYTGKGKTQCYDVTSGRYFEADKTSIEKIINKLNQRMLGGEMYISLNTFYSEIGLPHIPIGDDIGWNTDAIIEPHFSSQLDDHDNPVLVLDYLVAPRWNFSDFM
jgi:hypothetical protein